MFSLDSLYSSYFEALENFRARLQPSMVYFKM